MRRIADMLKIIIPGNSARFLPLLFLLLDACIEPFNLNIRSQENLVVDGLLSDQPGPHLIKIFRTLDLQSQLNVTEWITGATVSIFDEQENEVKLFERSAGNYVTDSAFQGVVGKTYRLQFSTTDGDKYESSPEKLLPVGDIDTVYHDFQINEDPTTLEHGSSKNGFAVYVDAQVLPEQAGMVRWRWTGTFGLQTYPELQTRPGDGRVIVPIPDPPSCSGYNKKLQYQGPCTCCHCYVSQYGDAVSISDPNFVSNGHIKGQNIVFIQANRRFLSEKYYLEIEQMSVSQEVYNFWKKISSQQVSSSSLFQTPPPPTEGNIHIVTGSTRILGIFSVSAIKRTHLEFTKADVSYNLMPIDTIAESCRVAYALSTTKKPSFW